jgi:predicted metalloprotease
MRLGGQRPSRNVEDRRGQARSGGLGGGFGRGPIRLPGGRGGGGIGLGGMLLLLGVMWLMGVNPLDLLVGEAPRQQVDQGFTRPDTAGGRDDEASEFVARVLGTTERVWEDIFAENGREYAHPRLVLFEDQTRSGCGLGAAAMGPFYCPADSTIYLDLSFFHELATRFGAPGEFAQAYVIAHEVAHHVQNLTGTLERTTAERARAPQAAANEISVRVELQADCYAGIWAHALAQEGTILEDGDIEDGMNAASAIGDDRLQRQTQGRVAPETFTHGTSAQRVSWFRRGMETGAIEACDTFGAEL